MGNSNKYQTESRAERIRRAREECERVLEYTPRKIIEDSANHPMIQKQYVRLEDPQKRNRNVKEKKRKEKETSVQSEKKIEYDTQQEADYVKLFDSPSNYEEEFFETNQEPLPLVTDEKSGNFNKKKNMTKVEQEEVSRNRKLLFVRFGIAGVILLGCIAIDWFDVKNKFINSSKIEYCVKNNLSIDQLEQTISDFLHNTVVPVLNPNSYIEEEGENLEQSENQTKE